MRTTAGKPISATARWMQEWQRLSWATTNQAMGHLLKACADVALAGTPQQALVALHKAHTDLLRHSADTFDKATRLWHKQNAALLSARANHAPTRQPPIVKSRTIRGHLA